MVDTLVPIAILVVVYGALAVVVWRRPLLGRLAWREATRRPAHSLLLVFGMMFSTAAILGMAGVSDTIGRATTANITQAWGRTDITVSQRGDLFNAGVASQLAADPRVAAGAAGVQGGFLLIGSVADIDRRLSAAPVEIRTVSQSSSPFDNFTLNDGRTTDGASLGNDEAIISTFLAHRVDAHLGDRLRMNFVAGTFNGQVEVRIAGIIKPGDSRGIAQQPVLFVPLAIIQGVTGLDSINIVRVSANGDGQREIENARALAPAVRAAVASSTGGGSLVVREVKSEDLASNERMGRSIGPFLIALSFFVVLAATAVVVNLSLAIAEERRPRLAVLRALGLTRTGLTLVAVIEGAIYSLAASLVGILPGLAYVYVVASRPVPGGDLIQESGSGNSLDVLAISAASIALAVCLGALITLATILIVSVRNSRMSISSAIRDLPDPSRHRRRSWIRLAGIIGLGVIGVAAWIQGSAPLRPLSGAALVLAASMLAAGRLSERVRATLLGAALVAWAMVSMLTSTIGNFAFGEGVPLALAALVVAVFGAAILLSANLRLLETAIRFVSADIVATLRPPLAYLTRRPVRAGLATGSFALVLAVLAYFAFLFPNIGPDPRNPAGGYDVRVTALGGRPFAIPDSLQSQVAKAESLRTLSYVGPRNEQFAGNSSPNGWVTAVVPLYPLTEKQLDQPPLTLSIRDGHYPNDRAVWRAIRDNPNLVVGTSLGLGHITLVGRDGEMRFQIIAVVTGVTLGPVGAGYVGSERTFASLSTSGSGTTILVDTALGVDPATFARELRLATFDEGVDAVTYAELSDLFIAGNSWFAGFFTILLQVSVVVGVLSLGIVALRAAIERRRSIGVLRALGYRPAQVLAGMLVEATTAATVGIAAGIGVGLGVSLTAFAGNGIVEGRVDFSQVIVPAVLIYVAVLLVTIVPAIRASRLPASEALRIMA